MECNPKTHACDWRVMSWDKQSAQSSTHLAIRLLRLRPQNQTPQYAKHRSFHILLGMLWKGQEIQLRRQSRPARKRNLYRCLQPTLTVIERLIDNPQATSGGIAQGKNRGKMGIERICPVRMRGVCYVPKFTSQKRGRLRTLLHPQPSLAPLPPWGSRLVLQSSRDCLRSLWTSLHSW